jgi:hypothetical protein
MVDVTRSAPKDESRYLDPLRVRFWQTGYHVITTGTVRDHLTLKGCDELLRIQLKKSLAVRRIEIEDF